MRNNEITWIGKILRRSGIDELPQLINIIFMEMSFVGPRPLTKEDIVRLEWTSEYYTKRWDLKPGLVGLAQLSPICSRKMSWFLDLSYLKNQSIGLDTKILLSAILIPLFGKKKVISWIHKR